MRRPSFDDHRAFCRIDGWTRRADKPGRSVSKHEVWTKALPGGGVLRTSVSKGRGEYGPGLFTRILRHQLRVTAEQFWTAVETGTPTRRERSGAGAPGATTVPLRVFLRLRSEGRSDDEIRSLSPEEVERLTREE